MCSEDGLLQNIFVAVRHAGGRNGFSRAHKKRQDTLLTSDLQCPDQDARHHLGKAQTVEQTKVKNQLFLTLYLSN